MELGEGAYGAFWKLLAGDERYTLLLYGSRHPKKKLERLIRFIRIVEESATGHAYERAGA